MRKDIDGDVESNKYRDEFLSVLGVNKKDGSFEKNKKIINSVIKISNDVAKCVDKYKLLMNISDNTILASKESNEILEIFKEIILSSLPEYVSLPAIEVSNFLKENVDEDLLYELLLLGVSEAEIVVSARKGKYIKLKTLKMLSRQFGVDLSKSVGIDNFRFNEGYTLNECMTKVDMLNEVLNCKKSV